MVPNSDEAFAMHDTLQKRRCPLLHHKPDLGKGHKDSYSLMSTINCVEAKKGFNGGFGDSYPDIHLFDGRSKCKSIEKTFIDNFGSEGGLRGGLGRKEVGFGEIVE